MDLPNNIFAFESKLVLHIYIACGEFERSEFTDYIDDASLENVPEKVNIYYAEGTIEDRDLAEVQKHIKSRFKVKPALFPFDQNGKFGSKESKASAFLSEGKDEVIRRREPVLLPPPGRSFAKPSGTRESYFIQSANLFVRHAEMSFFALLLIREWDGLFDEKIKTVYVDTIDLYGLVSIACRMRFGDNKHAPITVSFSSYTGYQQVLKRANVAESLMVISATTTHSLLGKILKNTRWKSVERVVTILDLDPKYWHSKSKVEEPRIISHITPPKTMPHTKLLPAIRLSGEKFTVEVDDPKSVVLNVTEHAKCLKHLKLKSLKEMVSSLSGYAKMGSDRLPIRIDTDTLFESEIFLDWLKKEIERYAPASTSHIVCIGEFEKKLEPLLEVFEGRKPKIINPDQLRKAKFEIKGSVVVICPTFTSGTKLLEVSRDLRKHVGHKNIVYFTGIGTPVSLEDFKKLKRNLEHQVYQVRSYCNVCTGQQRSLGLSWEAEQELLRDEENGLGSVSDLNERARALENGCLSDQSLFYRIADLDLHEGFKLWEDVVEPYPSSRPSLLLFATFAFLLQNARTDESLPDKDRLSPLPNRRVLLDPENFFRFNDSLIQIAILRAAFPGELDFSDHVEHSASIYYLVQRAEQVKQRAVVYEFLLALATKRLSITTVEIEKVRLLLESSNMLECKWFMKVDLFKNEEILK